MNLTPDFPRAASLIDALQKRSFGTDIDGIISVDPVALASVLRAAGPVKVGDETFTAGNVVRKLLNEVYQRYETRDEQDAYFDRASREIFNTLVTRDVKPMKVLRQLGRAAGVRNVVSWCGARIPTSSAGSPAVRSVASCRATPATSPTSGCT